jgi:hypothetical protein
MKVLTVTTDRGDLRAEIIGWSCEDSSMYVPNERIGMTPSPLNECHVTTVLQALAEGWEMLAPPTRYEDETSGEYWGWWLIKPDINQIKMLIQAAQHLLMAAKPAQPGGPTSWEEIRDQWLEAAMLYIMR